MNFLQLCQRMAAESRTVSGTLPTTVTGQTGRLKKIVDWTADAWLEVQNAHASWRWMRKEFTGTLTASTAKYTAASFSLSRFAAWITEKRSLTIYKTATGVADEGELRIIEWPHWRQMYGRGSQTENRPTDVAVSPANELCFGAIPDAGYTVNGEYMRGPQTLSANADIPECPERFHMIIVWRALLLMAEHDEGAFHVAAARTKYNSLLHELETDQLPKLGIGGGPLA